MGVYSRNVLGERSNSIDHHRESVDHHRGSIDYISEDFTRKVHVGNGKHIDIGRDSVVDPNDIATILRKKAKESKPLYR